ncbi:MAG: aerotolerance regulator BatA [Flavobacteriales bacterium]|nr:aerotolerance regulator BatA [Flavobacteriales bacterium]|tara:strand:+ start:201 stop:1202 length:1002 start_codon:yes stop_codon:yes gene_type:complete
MFENIYFLNPNFLWMFILLPGLIFWEFYSHKNKQAYLQLSNLSALKRKTLRVIFRPILFILRIAALSLIITALARPQTSETSIKSKTNKGIDIVMAIDVSSSMLAQDLKPNRLSALKRVASNFIDDRVSDRIGLVIYAGESYTLTPITSDKKIIKNSLSEIQYQGLIEDGTAIGMGLATSVNRLKDSKAKSKVIILLTDGVNNSGFIDPKIASELANEFQIKTYTIGIGSNGTAKAPIGILPNGNFQYGMTKVEIDEPLLKSIADVTGGQYFRATDNEKLAQIYSVINKLEKTEIEEFKYTNYDEKYRPFIIVAIILIVLEFILRNTFFRSFV